MFSFKSQSHKFLGGLRRTDREFTCATEQVKAPPKLRQVGVFLDMDEGQVTFYNIKSGSEIYSFTRGREFTDRMFPLFGTGDKDVPLVLMTTQHHLV